MRSFVPHLYICLALLALALISFLLYEFIDWKNLPGAIQTVVPMFMGILTLLILTLVIFLQLRRGLRSGRKKVDVRYF